MFTQFFLTLPHYLYPDEHNGRIIYSSGSTGHGSTIQCKKSKEETLTFENAVEKFARDVSRNDNGNKTFSLINIDDAVTFQLESVAVIEGTYCTYNTESKLIGFGGRYFEAENATKERYGSNSVGFRRTTDVHEGTMLDFNFEKPTPEPSYTYRVTDGFYESVLNELIPYIDYMKFKIFKRVAESFIYNMNPIDDYIDNYFENYKTSPDCKVSTSEIILAFTMFLNDDKVLIDNKDKIPSEYLFMGALCRRFQVLTNETF